MDPQRIHLIYNALPPEPEGMSLSQAEARAQLGLGDEAFILTAGRLHQWKGVDHLLTALRQLPIQD